MTGFLTDDELYTLTRRTQGAARIRVLKRQGIAFKLDGNGDPVVTWESVNRHSGSMAKQRGINYQALDKILEKHGTSTHNRT
jgi:hypothetical protein